MSQQASSPVFSRESRNFQRASNLNIDRLSEQAWDVEGPRLTPSPHQSTRPLRPDMEDSSGSPAQGRSEVSGHNPALINAVAEILMKNGFDMGEAIVGLRNAFGNSTSSSKDDGAGQPARSVRDSGVPIRNECTVDRSIWDETPICTSLEASPSRPIRSSSGRGLISSCEPGPTNTAIGHGFSTPGTGPSQLPPVNEGFNSSNPFENTGRMYEQLRRDQRTNHTSGPRHSSDSLMSMVRAWNIGNSHTSRRQTNSEDLSANWTYQAAYRHASGLLSSRAPASFSHTASQYASNDATPPAFRPMQAVLDSTKQPHAHSRIPSLETAHPPTAMAPLQPFMAKFSDKYYGMHSEGNASADHLPDYMNCALWLRNLPPDVTYREMLASIRNIGRIWCTYINTPDFVTHTTAAAKIVFFTPHAAQTYLRHVETENPTIRGFRIKADLNRIKSAQSSLVGSVSRVLIITGESWFVNEASLTEWFAEKFVFQVDRVFELMRVGNRAVVEFRFGSYRCQAQMGKMAFDRMQPPGLESVEFGDDPCEKGETLRSFKVAMERIYMGQL